MEYSVKVDAFEGPLDLLLHLINRFEIDIYDIPVATITEQYMMYIHTMNELQLDVASEYLVMAATLIQIKSKMLLPTYDEDDIDDSMDDVEEDPREQLMQQLIEYRKFKEAAVELQKLEETQTHIYAKAPSNLQQISDEKSPQQDSGDLDVSLYDMLSALQKLMKRKQLQKPAQARVARQDVPIEKRMTEIVSVLQKTKGKQSFYKLFPYPERNHIVVTFLAILELMKKNEVIVEQSNNLDELYVAYQERNDER
ncbi:segregation/condensation protein A [Priestia flexa]|uniref:Segregation and condensation protein A n=1 Tax=Priestia flexa TaxID=86664 RepID=A0A8I1MCN2_9BACI|nr:segregation/condensation protein A [Priestia flexa]MBN8250273.1 segregation/condensation protein A [Priestia flexa]MBN8432905.1 segregation/condensation protein A [Priestia flexa]MCA0965109.1 segregation/condensation protein A [Priestia flexa]MCA1200512.1 segregation/condensation protein A [Priestia flexa]RIV15590.1 segregation/condensation protein A [Priestia flexa]